MPGRKEVLRPQEVKDRIKDTLKKRQAEMKMMQEFYLTHYHEEH